MPIPIDHRDITLSPGSGEPVNVKVHFEGLTNPHAAEDRVKVTSSSSAGEATEHEVLVSDANGNEIVSISWTIDFDAGRADWESAQQVQFPMSTEDPKIGEPTHFWEPPLPDDATLRLSLGAASSSYTVSITGTGTNGAPPFLIRVLDGSSAVFEAEMKAEVQMDALRGHLNTLARTG